MHNLSIRQRVAQELHLNYITPIWCMILDGDAIMPRVFHITLTKTFDCTILADSEKDIEQALEENEDEIDRDWNPPNWEWTINDPLKMIKNSVRRVPSEVGDFDMVVLNGELFSAQESGQTKLAIDAAREQAQKDLDELRLKLGVGETNLKLSF